MHFFRIAGAVILAFSGFSFAYIMNASVSKKTSQAEALVELMRFIRVQIECFALPASEIIWRFDHKLLKECGFSGGSLCDNFEEFFDNLSIEDEESRSILKAFSAGFGKSYRDEQLKECDYYIEMLEARSRTLSEDMPKRKKVNSTLCISSALALIILLV